MSTGVVSDYAISYEVYQLMSYWLPCVPCPSPNTDQLAFPFDKFQLKFYIHPLPLTERPFTSDKRLINRDSDLVRAVKLLGAKYDRVPVLSTAAPRGSGKSAWADTLGDVFRRHARHSHILRAALEFGQALGEVAHTRETNTAVRPGIAGEVGDVPDMTMRARLVSFVPLICGFNNTTGLGVEVKDELSILASGLNSLEENVPVENTKSKLELKQDLTKSVRKILEREVALRIAHAAFCPEQKFYTFHDQWREAGLKVADVLKQIKRRLLPGRNLLLIVDELSKTLFPGKTLDIIYIPWFKDSLNKNDRIVLTSLTPTELIEGGGISGRAVNGGVSSSNWLLYWVPFSRNGGLESAEIVKELQWLHSDDSPQKVHTRELLRFAFSLASDNWRARAHLFSRLVDQNSVESWLTNPSQMVRAVVDIRLQLWKSPPVTIRNYEVVLGLLTKSVARLPTVLVRPLDQEKFERTHASEAYWLMQGFLSNTIDISDTTSKILHVPLALVYALIPLRCFITDVLDAEIVNAVEQLLDVAVQSFQRHTEHNYVRFEIAMATWLKLFMLCAKKQGIKSLNLCGITGGPVPAILPEFVFFDNSARALSMDAVQPSVWELDAKLSKAHEVKARAYHGLDTIAMTVPQPQYTRLEDSPPGTIFLPVRCETAVDLILFLSGRLILFQTRLLERSMTNEKFKTDIANLSTFRRKLWQDPYAATSEEIPPHAESLGLPAIEETNVTFVLVAPSGKSDPKNSNKLRQTIRQQGAANIPRPSACQVCESAYVCIMHMC